MLPDEQFWNEAGWGGEYRATDTERTALRAYVEHRADLKTTLSDLMLPDDSERPIKFKLSSVGMLYHEVVLQFPSEHARLAELLVPTLEMKPEKMGWTEEQKQRYPDWRKESSPHPVCRFLLDDRDVREGYRYESTEEDEESLEDWSRINSFFAHWCRIDRGTHLQWSVHRIRDALENQQSRKKLNETPSISYHDMDIQGLAPYLYVSGSELYRLRDQRDAFPEAMPLDGERTDLNPPGAVVLWQGPTGWSVERWIFWKRRLVEIRNEGDIRSDTKVIIDRTIAEMNRLEEIR